MAEYPGHGGRGLLSSVSCGVAGHAGLSQEELKCPICVDTIQDAFVTACGHTFCYSCISTHLKNKRSCPSCSNYLTQEHIHPNFLLNKILQAAATSPAPRQPGLVDTLHAMLRREGRSRPGVADMQAAIQLLQEKKQEFESHEEWHSLQLLLLFLQHMRAEKEAAAAELQRQLAFLSRDLKAVSGQANGHMAASSEYGNHIAMLPGAQAAAAANPASKQLAVAAAAMAAPQAPLFAQQQQVLAPQASMAAGMPRAVSAPSLTALIQERQQQQKARVAAHAMPPPQQQQAMASSSRQVAAPDRKRKTAAPAALQLPVQQQQQQQQGWPSSLAAFSQGPTLGEGLGIGHGFKPYLAPSASPRLAVVSPSAMASPSAAAEAEPADDASPRLSSNGGSGGSSSGGNGGAAGKAAGAATAAGGSGRDEAGSGEGARGSKKRRIMSQFEELQEAYLAMHAQQQQQQQQQQEEGKQQVEQGQQEQQQEGDVAAPAAKQGTPKATCADEAGDDDDRASTSNSSGTPPPPCNPSAPAAATPAAATAPAPAGANEAQSPPAQTAANEPHTRAGLNAFHEVLAAATHYSRLQLVADVPPAVVEERRRNSEDSNNSGSSSGSADEGGTCNVLSSIEFDMEGRVMAVAGVQQRILLYDYGSVADGGERRSQHTSPATPLLTMPSRSRVSCLSFSRSTQAELLSSDYDGGVVLWDAESGKATAEWDAHTRRIWSVDFSREEADMFATGSDDGKVRLWTTGERDALMSLDVQANVCSVQFCPEAGHLLAVGSAGHAVLLYDMRSAREPYQVLLGHGKAVSYVRWMGGSELVSASTDGTLRLWDADDGSCVRTYSGHTNSRNFVGLSVEDGLIACGSETNEVYVYCKAMPRPTISYRLGGGTGTVRRSESGDSTGDCGGSGGSSGECFVSAVCWKPGSNVLMAANSQGSMCALALQP